jgi:hypothetical protein
MTADMEQALGKFIGEQNPFTEMRLPPDWQTDETIVTFPSVTDVWATLMQDPHTRGAARAESVQPVPRVRVRCGVARAVPGPSAGAGPGLGRVGRGREV